MPPAPSMTLEASGAPAVSPLTLDLAQRLVEQVLVESDRTAVLDVLGLLDHAKVLSEPAAGCTRSAARRLKGRFGPEAHVVLITCGTNVTLDEVAAFRARVGL